MNSIHDLDLFVALAKSLNYKRAASSLGIPASTLSRRIAQLEHDLGVSLFVRTTRRVELTPAAKLFLSRCDGIVDAIRDARAELQGLAAAPKGRLRISMEADVGSILLAPAIAKLHRKYPEISLDIDLSPRRVDLVAEGFDAAVRIGGLADSSLIARELVRLRVGLYAGKTYLRRHGKPSRPEDLAGHSRLHLLHHHDDGSWILRNGNQTAHVSSRGALILANGMTMLRGLLRQNIGIAVMDELMAQKDVRANRIERVLPKWELPPVPISILTQSRILPARTRVFIDFISAELQGG